MERSLVIIPTQTRGTTSRTLPFSMGCVACNGITLRSFIASFGVSRVQASPKHKCKSFFRVRDLSTSITGLKTRLSLTSHEAVNHRTHLLKSIGHGTGCQHLRRTQHESGARTLELAERAKIHCHKAFRRPARVLNTSNAMGHEGDLKAKIKLETTTTLCRRPLSSSGARSNTGAVTWIHSVAKRGLVKSRTYHNTHAPSSSPSIPVETNMRSHRSNRNARSGAATALYGRAKTVSRSRADTVQGRHELQPWQIQKSALSKKFGSSTWSPRKRLSPDSLEGIRALHAQYPDKYTTAELADQFKVSPDAIRRILKSKWRPNDDEDEQRRARWNKRGVKIWSQMNELGVKPPRKWRVQGVGKSSREGLPSQTPARFPNTNPEGEDQLSLSDRIY